MPDVQIVTLEPISDDQVLERVGVVAATDAEPWEVMPGAIGVHTWTAGLREGFRAFHRSRFGGLDGPEREQGWAVVAQGQVVGVVRLRHAHDSTFEVGIWIATSRRGEGLGTAAVATLRSHAAALGAHDLVAETTTTNAAALGVLRHHGARLTLEGGGALRGRFE